jgi:hypothetical protein
MSTDPRLPAGLTTADLPDRVADGATPGLRRWLDDPENAIEAELLIADFVADDGMEMTWELIGSRPGAQVQQTVDRFLSRLRERLERWLTDGQPRLHPSPNVRISFSTGAMERAAEALLTGCLAAGLAYSLTSHHRVGGAAGAAPWMSWSCRITDPASDRAVEGAESSTPQQAARLALEAWDAAATTKPPQLNAPSRAASTAAAPQEQKRVS